MAEHFYTFDSRVRYSETDMNGQLTLTGIVNYLQDCSTFQSEDLGVGIQYLNSIERAWLLSSWQIEIERYPSLGEKLTVGTWAYDFKGMYGYRNFMIADGRGDYLVKANSMWFYLDTAVGRPVRVTAETVSKYPHREKLDMEYLPRKISLPEQCSQLERFTVQKHHLDSNRHVNNSQYVDMARDFVPEDYVVRRLRAEYKKAAVLGDVVVPRMGKTDQGYVISLGAEDGTAYAVVELTGSVSEERKG